MKKLKKIISSILLVAVIISCLSIEITKASDEYLIKRYGNFYAHLKLYDSKQESFDGQAMIFDIHEIHTPTIEIPESISDEDGKLYKVTRVCFSERIMFSETLFSLEEYDQEGFHNSENFEIFFDENNEEPVNISEHALTYYTKLILPDTVEYVKLDDFGTKKKPFTLVLGENVETIKKDNFTYTTVDINNNIHFKIENNLLINDKTVISAFKQKSSYKLPDYIEEIGDRAFYESNVKKLTLSKKLKRIGERGFMYSKIESITIPKTVTEIGKYAFCGSELATLKFASRSKDIYIGDKAFSSCNNVTKLTVPAYIDTSGYGFEEMGGLKTVKFAKKYKKSELPMYCFRGCKKITELVLPSSIKVLKNSSLRNTRIKSIKLPENLETIEENVFYYCTKLESITLPKSCTEIGQYAFYRCINLKNFTSKGKIKNIPKSAFSMCKSLETVNFKGLKLGEMKGNVFYNVKSLKKITIANTKNAPNFTGKYSSFRKTNDGIKFYVKNKTVAKKLKANLKKVGYTSAKIYANGKLYK